MPDTPEIPNLPRRQISPDDCYLYPALINHYSPEPPLRWYQRARRALAEYLAEPTEHIERRWNATNGVRAYQRELALRAHSVLRQRVRDGWWLGPAPYGYRLRQCWVGDRYCRANQRHRLIPDWQRAGTVPVIFDWYVHEHLTERAILARLVAHPQQHPQPLDPVTAQQRPWTPDRVRTVLAQPAYLGFSVWGRTTHGQPRLPHGWVWSDQPSHQPLVGPAQFWGAYDRLHRLTVHTEHGATNTDDPSSTSDEDGPSTRGSAV